MAGKRILMICGDYSEDYEVMVPFQALLAVGHEVHAVCPGKKAGEQIATAVHDFEGRRTPSGKTATTSPSTRHSPTSTLSLTMRSSYREGGRRNIFAWIIR